MPVSAILIRTLHHRSIVKLHASLMIFAWVLSLIALGTGIYIAFYAHMLSYPHSIIDFIVILGCVLQPVTGWWHHALYKKRTGNGSGNGKEVGSTKRTYKVTYMHVWWGRILITLGIINDGLGLQLARRVYVIDTPIAAEIGYGIGAGVVCAVWIGVSFVVYLRNKRRSEAGKSEKVLGMQVESEEEKTPVVLETPQSEEEKDM
jgi:hypothetical protein